jgi:hypothetical protein
MNKLLGCIFFLCSFCLMESQNWDSIRGGIFNNQLERILYDEVHDELIVSSKFVKEVGNKYIRGIGRWDGARWDSLSSGINTHDQLNTYPNGMVLASIEYQGKLLVGGMFQSIGGVNATSLALWDGVKWDSLPKRAFRFNDVPIQVCGFIKKGSLLYIAGNFDTIAGQATKGLATWDGTNFNPVALPVGPGFQNISSIMEYNNEIYIAGDGFLIGPNNDARDVFKYNGTNWTSTTGNGLNGVYAGIADLEIYNNELYACGHFTKEDGNSGNHVMKWNGVQWKDVGFGDQQTFVNMRKMLVHKNRLWVFGGFDEAAGSFASNAAVYDGTSWCGLSDTLDNKIGSAVVYHDTIYIGGGFWKSNSDSIKFIAKLKNPSLYNSCINVGINETKLSETIKIYPNPTTSSLNILDEQNDLSNSSIEISNSIGQTIFQMPFSNAIDVSTLPEGCYFITITAKENQRLRSKFVKY